MWHPISDIHRHAATYKVYTDSTNVAVCIGVILKRERGRRGERWRERGGRGRGEKKVESEDKERKGEFNEDVNRISHHLLAARN